MLLLLLPLAHVWIDVWPFLCVIVVVVVETVVRVDGDVRLIVIDCWIGDVVPIGDVVVIVADVIVGNPVVDGC